MTLSAVVVGLGRIGMLYDLEADSHHSILTHVRSLYLNHQIELIGGVDPDPGKVRIFEALTNRRGAVSISGLPVEERVHLAVIATPTAAHLDTLEQLLDRFDGLQVVLCEKPIHFISQDALKVSELCEDRGIKLFVNYFRRCEPASQRIRRSLKYGLLKGPFSGTAWYAKGLRHNGSHAVDLLTHWLGPIRDFKVRSIQSTWPLGDLGVEVDCLFDDARIKFAPQISDRQHSCAIELVSSTGSLRYGFADEVTWSPNLGLNANETHEPEAFPLLIDSDFDRYQAFTLDCVIREVNGERTSLCTGREAIATLSLINDILSEAHGDG